MFRHSFLNKNCGGILRCCLIAGAALLLSSCSARMAREAPAASSYADPAPPMSRATPALAQDAIMPALAEAAGPAPVDLDRHLIKMAQISLQTDDPAAAAQNLTQSVVSRGGYVANLQESTNGLGQRSLQMEVRVPAAALDETLRQLEPLGKLLNKHISTQDVTEEYVDTNARMRNLKKTEERILDHLNRLATLDDILKVEQELSRVRGEIEQMEGRLRFLDHRIDFSSIQVSLIEAAKAEPVTPPRDFSTQQEFTRALRSLVAVLLVAWAAAIWIAVWSPVWIVVGGLPLLIIWLRARRRTA